MNRQLEMTAIALDLRDTSGFEAAVERAGGWVLARTLCAQAGWPFSEENQRNLRAAASACPRIISGNKGYCHEENASVEEISHSADRLLSQVREMTARVIRLRQSAHRRLHGTKDQGPKDQGPRHD